jgi:hypothetical protein
MKYLFTVILVFCSVLTCLAQSGNASELANADLHRYSVRSATITYDISGDAEGTATYSFTEWGWKDAMQREMTYTLYGMKSEESRLEMRDGDIQYTIDLATKKGKSNIEKQLSGLMKYKSAKESREAIFNSQSAVKSGEDTILGKNVNIWIFETGNTLEVWEWEGIPLKIIKKLSKVVYTLTATEISLDVGGEINLPEGINWTN